MQYNKEAQEYFKSKYYNKDKNYEIITSKIKEKEMSKNKILKVVAMLMIIIISTTGIGIAGSKFYNEYIKNQGEIDSKELLNSRDGYEYTENMTFSKDINSYYKIITDKETFDSYKEQIAELPYMEDKDFNNNFLVLIANKANFYPHMRDVTISEIKSDETTLYIKLMQKENPNYDKTSDIIYAIVDKELLRENIDLKLDLSNIKNKNFIDIKNLSEDYSKEEAIEDGCLVIDQEVNKPGSNEFKVLSNDPFALDKLIENANKGIESSIRIYFDDRVKARIIDVTYKDDIYIINVGYPGTEVNFVNSAKYLMKEHIRDNLYAYSYNSRERTQDAAILIYINLD